MYSASGAPAHFYDVIIFICIIKNMLYSWSTATLQAHRSTKSHEGTQMRNIQVGSINGDNNQVQQNNYNIKNVHHNGGGSGGRDRNSKDGNEGGAVFVAVGAATILAAVLYLKYHEPIFLWLKLLLLATAGLHFYSLLIHWQAGEDEDARAWHPFAGIVFCVAQALVLLTALGALPAEVLDEAARPTRAQGGIPWALEVWGRFNSTGHQLILDNMAAVLALAVSIAIGFLFSLQHVFDVMAMAIESRLAGHVANVLRGFKTKGAWLAVLFAAVSYVIATGVLRN